MIRDRKTEQEKELRRLWTEYIELSQKHWRRESGTWVEVEPYQKGWVRKFVLRDDIKNRTDAKEIRHVLDLINVSKVCSRKDFTEKSWKTKKYEPIVQKLKRIDEATYNKLSEKEKSYFGEWLQIDKKDKHYRKTYAFKYDFWFVFEIKPNMITRHWIPDAELESRYTEIRNKLQTHNLWPKIDHILGVSHHDYWDRKDQDKFWGTFESELSDEGYKDLMEQQSEWDW